ADDFERLVQTLLVAEDRDVLVHRLAELGLDLGYAPAILRPAHDLADAAVLVVDLGPGDVGVGDATSHVGRVHTGAAAEDQRVEQRVRAQAVAAVNRHAGDLTGCIEARDVGKAVDVGL